MAKAKPRPDPMAEKCICGETRAQHKDKFPRVPCTVCECRDFVRAGYCRENVSDGRTGLHQCSRRGVVERDGKLYCQQHDPVAVKARRDAAYAEYRAEQDAYWQRQKQADADADVGEALRELLALTGIAETRHEDDGSYTVRWQLGQSEARGDTLLAALRAALTSAKALSTKPRQAR